MFPERDCQEDCVGLECIPQRLGDYRGSNCPSLRCQRLGRPAARDDNVDFFTGEGVSQGLAYLAESYNCIFHNVFPMSCYGPPQKFCYIKHSASAATSG